MNPTNPIIKARETLAMSQSKLAELLGVTRPTIAAWERKEPPRVAVLALSTVMRNFSSLAKQAADESGKI